MNPWLVIPTRDRTSYLTPLCKAAPGRTILIQTGGNTWPGVVNIIDTGPINIHRWWNRGLDYAEEHGARYVAVANDDVGVTAEELAQMRDALIETGSTLCWAHETNLTGWLWMIDITHQVRPDEKFRWWFGDNDLSIRSRAAHGVTGVNVGEHYHPNLLTQIDVQLQVLAARDLETFEHRYGVAL